MPESDKDATYIKVKKDTIWLDTRDVTADNIQLISRQIPIHVLIQDSLLITIKSSKDAFKMHNQQEINMPKMFYVLMDVEVINTMIQQDVMISTPTANMEVHSQDSVSSVMMDPNQLMEFVQLLLEVKLLSTSDALKELLRLETHVSPMDALELTQMMYAQVVHLLYRKWEKMEDAS